MPDHKGPNGYTLPEDVEVAFHGDRADWVPEIATDADYDPSELVVLPDALTVANSGSDVVVAPYTAQELFDLRDRRFDAILPIPDSTFLDF